MPEYTIKNMVCARCLKTVTGIFREAGVSPVSIRLGAVDTNEALTPAQENLVREKLHAEGFQLLDDQRRQLIEQVKNIIVDLVHYGELDEMNVNLSTLLTGKLHKDYNALSNLFSAVEGTTIEQYFILQKTEKVKELLVYDELSLSQIAFKLGYSSSAHLSNQFKKMTGFTPREFKKNKDRQRNHLDRI